MSIVSKTNPLLKQSKGYRNQLDINNSIKDKTTLYI